MDVEVLLGEHAPGPCEALTLWSRWLLSGVLRIPLGVCGASSRLWPSRAAPS